MRINCNASMHGRLSQSIVTNDIFHTKSFCEEEALASAGVRFYVVVMMRTSVIEMSRSSIAKNTACQFGSANCE